VMKALNSPTAKTYGWSLAPRRQVLPQWERRGRPEEMVGKKGKCRMMMEWGRRKRLTAALAEGVIRCMPGEDKTNGFFVACFVKDTDAEEEREEGTGQCKKRQRDELQLDGAVEVDREVEGAMVEGQEAEDGPGMNAEEKAAKALTDAQRERKRRKKQAQKNRRQGA
jgi:putative methyltransferase